MLEEEKSILVSEKDILALSNNMGSSWARDHLRHSFLNVLETLIFRYYTNTIIHKLNI